MQIVLYLLSYLDLVENVKIQQQEWTGNYKWILNHRGLIKYKWKNFSQVVSNWDLQGDDEETKNETYVFFLIT